MFLSNSAKIRMLFNTTLYELNFKSTLPQNYKNSCIHILILYYTPALEML